MNRLLQNKSKQIIWKWQLLTKLTDYSNINLKTRFLEAVVRVLDRFCIFTSFSNLADSCCSCITTMTHDLHDSWDKLCFESYYCNSPFFFLFFFFSVWECLKLAKTQKEERHFFALEIFAWLSCWRIRHCDNTKISACPCIISKVF